MTPRRASTTAVLAVVGATMLVVLLATLAAAGGPDAVLRGVGPQVGSSYVPSPTPTPGDDLAKIRKAARDDAAQHPAPVWLRLLVGLLEALIAAAVLVALARWLWRLARAVRERLVTVQAAPEQLDFETLDPAVALAAALDADSTDQRETLSHGEPRNAIVACWARFETAAERAGVRREAWQTSAEFVLDVLEQAGADHGAVTGLSELYREARFSDHPLTEDHRRRALEALDGAQRSWRRPVSAAPA